MRFHWLRGSSLAKLAEREVAGIGSIVRRMYAMFELYEGTAL